LHGLTIPSGRCASVSEVRSLVISDSTGPDKVTGVHDMKGTDGEKPSTLPTLFDEVNARINMLVWLHDKYCIFKSFLMGNGNCAYERFILIGIDELLWMISRSNDGLSFIVNKSRRPNALECVTKIFQHIVCPFESEWSQHSTIQHRKKIVRIPTPYKYVHRVLSGIASCNMLVS
jgi:hypothetical protein